MHEQRAERGKRVCQEDKSTEQRERTRQRLTAALEREEDLSLVLGAGEKYSGGGLKNPRGLPSPTGKEPRE